MPPLEALAPVRPSPQVALAPPPPEPRDAGAADTLVQAPAPTTVAILGAGAAGLAAAKSMLEAGLAPTVFDRAPGVGGLWATAVGRCWQSLRTNLSRYACAFSDHPWRPGTSMFPTQPEVDRYLRDYADAFLHTGVEFRLGTEVRQVRPTSAGRWEVLATTAEGERLQAFDRLVVASGFFAQASAPRLPGLERFGGPVLHSADYHAPEALAGQRVAVVGASLSAVEIAAELAVSARSLVHVAPRPFWVLPRYLPASPGVPQSPFLPLDLVFYRRGAPGPHHEVVAQAGADYGGSHCAMRAFAGGLEAHLPAGLQANPRQPPSVTISDGYLPMLSAGRITPRQGCVESVQARSLTLAGGETVDDLDAVVLCTGYRPDLGFFPQAVRDTLRWDAHDPFMPLVTHRSVFHPDLPNLAFVGMYRGPYFGVMEAQARWAAAVLSGTLPVPSRAEQDRGMAEALSLRALTPRPQFPHGDYLGLLDDTYGLLGTAPPAAYNAAGVAVVPAHYRKESPVAAATAQEVRDVIEQLTLGSGSAACVFNGLRGPWAFDREVIPHDGTSPSAVVRGAAVFASAPEAQAVWMYREDGDLHTEAGRYPATQQYRYALDEANGTLGVYFCKGENAGKHFHDLQFAAPAQATAASVAGQPGRLLRARGHHLCNQDVYDVQYQFRFVGSVLHAFSIAYDVKGPHKDYTARTQFARPHGG